MVSLARSSLQSLVALVLGLGLAFLTSIVLARYLGPLDNGRYAILVTLITLTQLIAGLGYPAAITYFGAHRGDGPVGGRLAALASTALLLALAAAAAVFALFALVRRTGWFEELLRRESLPPLLVWFALLSVLPYLVFQFMRQLLRSRGRIGEFNALTVVQVGGTCLLIWLALALAGADLTLAIAAHLLAATLAAGAALWRVTRLTPLRLRVDRALARSMTAFGLRSYVGSIFQFLSYKLDLLILTALAGPTQAGYYVVAVALAERLWDPASAVRVALQPHVTAAERDPAVAVTARFSRGLMALVLIGGVALAVLARPLVRLLFGAEYLPAAAALVLLVPGAAAFASAKLLSAFLASRGHPQIPSAIAGLGVAVNLPLNLLLIPRWGIAGCAVASSVTYLLLSVVTLGVMVRRYGVSPRDLLVVRASELAEYAARLRRRPGGRDGRGGG